MGDIVRIDPPHLPSPTAALASALEAAAASVPLYDAVLNGRNALTLKAYQADFRCFAGFVGADGPAAALDALVSLSAGTANAVAHSYRAHLVARGLAPATVARRLAALRSATKLARTLGRIDWTLSVEAPRVETLRDTRGPGDEGWRSLLSAARTSTTPKGVRDVAIVRLLHDLALRRAEVVSLDLDHVDLDGSTVMVLGKGWTQRARMTIPPPVKAALVAWLDVRGRDPGPLFVRLDPAGPGKGRLTGRSVHRMVGALGGKAGIARRVAPHQLRHAGITKALDVSNGNVREVQKFSRHRKLDVLLVYDDARADVAGELARRVSEE